MTRSAQPIASARTPLHIARTLITAILLAGVLVFSTGCDMIETVNPPVFIELPDSLAAKVSPASLPAHLDGMWTQIRDDKEYLFHFDQNKAKVTRWDRPRYCYWEYPGDIIGEVDDFLLVQRRYHFEYLKIEGTDRAPILKFYRIKDNSYTLEETLQLTPNKRVTVREVKSKKCPS